MTAHTWQHFQRQYSCSNCNCKGQYCLASSHQWQYSLSKTSVDYSSSSRLCSALGGAPGRLAAHTQSLGVSTVQRLYGLEVPLWQQTGWTA
jgi:hypothetical protein